tara:strand:+ start:64 stop:567 length:504 start_codon:yes stop_codon:yes gene_type:complete
MNKGLIAATAIGLATLSFPQAADAQQQSRRYGERSYSQPSYERRPDSQVRACELEPQTAYFLRTGDLTVRIDGYDQAFNFMRPIWGGYENDFSTRRMQQGLEIIEKVRRMEYRGIYPATNPQETYNIEKDIQERLRAQNCGYTYSPYPRDDRYGRRGYNNQDGYHPH